MVADYILLRVTAIVMVIAIGASFFLLPAVIVIVMLLFLLRSVTAIRFVVCSHSILLTVTVIRIGIAITVMFFRLLTATITEDKSNKNNSEYFFICSHSNTYGNSYYCFFSFSITDNNRKINAAFVTNSNIESIFLGGIILYYCSLMEKKRIGITVSNIFYITESNSNSDGVISVTNSLFRFFCFLILFY
jgi:hypothetical protein